MVAIVVRSWVHWLVDLFLIEAGSLADPMSIPMNVQMIAEVDEREVSEFQEEISTHNEMNFEQLPRQSLLPPSSPDHQGTDEPRL